MKNGLHLNTVELVTGVLIGASLNEMKSIVIPFSNVFQYYNFVDLAGITLAYFIVISGWMGYHRSITRRPHLADLGMLRYILDFFILFLVYYIIAISEPTAHEQYGMTFLWVIPALFVSYTFWDVIKLYEYRNRGTLSFINPIRMQLTLIFSMIFFILGITYYCLNVSYFQLGITFWGTKTSIDPIFIVVYIVLIAIYRYSKSRNYARFGTEQIE